MPDSARWLPPTRLDFPPSLREEGREVNYKTVLLHINTHCNLHA